MKKWLCNFIMVSAVPLTLAATERRADAHAILVKSVPAFGSHVRPGKMSVELAYNSLVDARRSRLDLMTQGGALTRLQIDPSGRGDGFTAIADLKPGEAELRWQVLALDGHVTRGVVAFTVDGQDRTPTGGH